MFETFTDATQKTPLAVVVMGSVPRGFWEQSTPVTVNSNFPSRTGVLSPAACAEPDVEPLPEDEPLPDDDESSLPPVAAAMMTMSTIRAMIASRMKRFFL